MPCAIRCRAAESVQKVTATGWKQAQQGLKGLAGGPLQVNAVIGVQYIAFYSRCKCYAARQITALHKAGVCVGHQPASLAAELSSHLGSPCADTL